MIKVNYICPTTKTINNYVYSIHDWMIFLQIFRIVLFLLFTSILQEVANWPCWALPP